MKAISWIFRKLTQNEFKAITDQIQSEGGGSQTYIDLPKGKISDDNLTDFFGAGVDQGSNKGYKWTVPVCSLGLDMPSQDVVISQRRDSSNCIREQNKEKRINIWKSEYSNFPSDNYDESHNPIYVFIVKSSEDRFYAGWFYSSAYQEKWFVTKDLCKPFFGESAGYDVFNIPIEFDGRDYNWPFRQLTAENESSSLNDEPLQLIYYGAPGTGKSYKIDGMTDEVNSVRTTFHPDSDYASFVGAYKPTMENVPMSAFVGKEVHVAQPQGEHPGKEKKIVYKYVPQAFLKAYVAAWKDLENPHFLVIEEINRGNCAQIFGDLFQLLDRNSQGASSYAIHADEDISQFLYNDAKGFALRKDGAEDGTSKEERDAIRSFILHKDNGKTEAIGADILSGKKLLLPPNLYIWATMNTSDQSLFPIDSAFKRRWNWEYVPIEYDKEDWLIAVDNERYRWGDFLSHINPDIFSLTGSADKQMGYYFVKPDTTENGKRNIISEKLFINKVLFYIWTDVLKDYDLDKEPFVYETENKQRKPFLFTDFFGKDASANLTKFFNGMKIQPVGDEEHPTDTTIDDNTTNISQEQKSGYIFNGNSLDSIGKVMQGVVGTLAPTMTYDDLEALLFHYLQLTRFDAKGGIKRGKPADLNTAYGSPTNARFYQRTYTSADRIYFALTNNWGNPGDEEKIFNLINSDKSHFPQGIHKA